MLEPLVNYNSSVFCLNWSYIWHQISSTYFLWDEWFIQQRQENIHIFFIRFTWFYNYIICLNEFILLLKSVMLEMFPVLVRNKFTRVWFIMKDHFCPSRIMSYVHVFLDTSFFCHRDFFTYDLFSLDKILNMVSWFPNTTTANNTANTIRTTITMRVTIQGKYHLLTMMESNILEQNLQVITNDLQLVDKLLLHM